MSLWKAATAILGVAVLLQQQRVEKAVTEPTELFNVLTESSMLRIRSEIIQIFIQGGLLQRFDDAECITDVQPHENRILRSLEASEYYVERHESKWCITRQGKTVSALRHWILLQQHLERDIRAGLVSHGKKNFYDDSDVFRDPDLRLLFARAMDDLTMFQLPIIVEIIKEVKKLVKKSKLLCDIGGGAGGLIKGIVSQGLFDNGVSLDSDVTALRLSNNQNSGVSGVKYDMFSGLTPEDELIPCEVIILKGITSDYSNIQFSSILNVTSNSFPGVPILLIDHFLVPQTSSNKRQVQFLYQMDVMMMALFGEASRQRSPDEVIAIATELKFKASYYQTNSTVSAILLTR